MQILEQRARKGTAKQIKMVVGRLAELGVAVPDEEIRLRAGDSRDRVVIRGFLPLKAFAIRVEFLFGRKFFEAEKETVIGDSFQLFLESTQEDERKINWDRPYIILRQGGTAFFYDYRPSADPSIKDEEILPRGLSFVEEFLAANGRFLNSTFVRGNPLEKRQEIV